MDDYFKYVLDVTRRTARRLGVRADDSVLEIAERLGVSVEQANATFERARAEVEAEMASEGIQSPPLPTLESFRASLATSDDVERVPDDELDGDEGWRRLTSDPHIRGVEATLSDRREWSWSIGVWVMEFVRDEPLEGELRDRIGAALRAVPGVENVAEEDREVWIVKGTPPGDELVRAVAGVVDSLEPALRRYVAGLGN